MLHVKITPLNLVLALTVGMVALPMVMPSANPFPSEEGRNIIYLNGEVTDESMGRVAHELDAIQERGPSRALLKLNSPGGSVFAGREVVKRLVRNDMPVDTYSDNLFASMAMSLFMQGEERIVSPDALGLIHRGSAGGMSYYSLKLMLMGLKEQVPDLNTLNTIIDLENTLSMMDKTFETDMTRLKELKVTAPDPEFMQTIIDRMIEGKDDVTLNASELLRSGLATRIESKKIDSEYN